MSSPLGVRQRPQEHAVDDAEDRGVGADAERHRQDDGGRKAAVPGQAPEGGAQVLRQVSMVLLGQGSGVQVGKIEQSLESS